MIQISLPDNSKISFESPVTLFEIAEKISKSLAKSAVAGKVNGVLKDLCVVVDSDCQIEIIKKSDNEGLDIIRHSFAHLIGHAVKQLYPQAKMAIGPVIENGFYYDIDFENNLSEFDLKKIEKKINFLIKQNYDVKRRVVSANEATEVFVGRNEIYKTEIIKEIPDGEIIALYHHQE